MQPAGRQIAGGSEDERGQQNVGRHTEGASARLDDQQHPGKARDGGQPSRQAHPFAVEHGRPGRHHQWRSLQHGIHRRQRQVAQGKHDKGRGAGGGGDPHQHQRTEQDADRPHGAGHGDAENEHAGRQQSPQDEELPGGQLRRDELHHRVVEDEGGGGGQHCQDATQVVGHARPTLARCCSRRKV